MNSKKNDFVHLHVHTEYSLLDGLSQITPLLQHVGELGMNSLAITDHGAMYGAVEFYKKANKAAIKPIIGMEAYISNQDHKKRGKDKTSKNYHLLLLAKNEKGYKNLMKLTSIAHLEGYYYRPRVDKKTLKKYSEGLICTSACVQGELAQALIEDDYEKALKVAQWHLDVYEDDYYLEVQKHEYEKFLEAAPHADIREEIKRNAVSEVKVNDGVLKISRELGIPVIATNDSHYIRQEDSVAQDALVCVATGKEVSDLKRLRFMDTPSFYVNSKEEMGKLFAETPEVLSNTMEVAGKCELEITIGQFYFPEVDLGGKNAEDVLRSEVDLGLARRFGEVSEELKERAKYELKVIKDKGYSAYFLIFKDMADWAAEQKVPVNTRGSAAGSLVSYALGITNVDPIRFLIPFERFLNPYRPSTPDIDMDIADDKREDMIAYLKERYGEEKVAQINTFGRMLARGSVRDIARVLGYPYEIGDRISKLIPMGAQGFPMTINRALKESGELMSLYEGDKDAKRIIDLSRKVEGNARHISVHAAGVVISPGLLTNFTPVQNDKPNGDKIITQYEMHALEDIGLVKLDVLGIRNLSILREAVARVQESLGVEVDLVKIPLDDKKTFEMLARGETMGVFQLSGSGMTRFLVDLNPEKIEDIMIMIALFRPGPMANIEEYILRKHGKKEIEYYHPKMEKFLDKSLGVLVYQDDLLYTALEVAGYDWEEVDKFRKAVGKKIPEEMAKQHIRFVEGAIESSGMTKEEAEGLWALFEPFQGYGFNKAHAASYGMVAYQTAYMKANYPVPYMAALMTAESGDTEKVAAAVHEAKRMGIEVFPPDINKSDIEFTLEDKGIRFGLSAIKNVGEAAIEAILSARDGGEFNSLSDFLTRVDARKVNKRVLESLIKVGALGGFGSRAGLLDAIDEIRSSLPQKHSVSQQGLFDDEKVSQQTYSHQIISSVDEFEKKEIEDFERQLLGFSLTARPKGELLADFVAVVSHKIDEIPPLAQNEKVRVAGVVGSVRVVTTKRGGQEMAFASMDDGTGSVDLVVFPKIYAETRNLWFEGSVVLIYGKKDSREDGESLLVDRAVTREELADIEGDLSISIPDKISVERLADLRDMLKLYPGSQRVKLVFGEGESIDLPFGIEWNEELSRNIKAISKLTFQVRFEQPR